MVMTAAPRPWFVTSNREIGDADGAVVQYTQANLGQIVLCVNAYDRLIAALTQIDDWLGMTPDRRPSDEDLRAAVKAAIGRIGCEQLAAMIEASSDASLDLDRRIAAELNVPEVGYTNSTDAAMTLVPKGWRYSVADTEQLDITSNEMVQVYMVECKSTDGQHVTKAANRGFARALAAAALRAQDIARA